MKKLVKVFFLIFFMFSSTFTLMRATEITFDFKSAEFNFLKIVWLKNSMELALLCNFKKNRDSPCFRGRCYV